MRALLSTRRMSVSAKAVYVVALQAVSENLDKQARAPHI